LEAAEDIEPELEAAEGIEPELEAAEDIEADNTESGAPLLLAPGQVALLKDSELMLRSPEFLVV